jgi:hypothetical protein
MVSKSVHNWTVESATFSYREPRSCGGSHDDSRFNLARHGDRSWSDGRALALEMRELVYLLVALVAVAVVAVKYPDR